MHNATPKHITIDLGKYKHLTDSLEVTQASSLASSANILGIGSMVKDNENFLRAIDRNSIFGINSTLFDGALNSYESAINPFNNDKSRFLTLSEQIGRSLATLTGSLGVTQASSFASTAKMLDIGSMVKDDESFLRAIDRNSIFGISSTLFNDAFKSYKSAINPFKNDKSRFLTLSEQIGKSLETLTGSLGVTQASSFASTAKMLGIENMVENNESLLKAIDRNSIFGNQFRHVDLQTKLSDLISASNGDLVTKMMESIQHQPIAVLNTDYVPSETELITAAEILYEETNQQSFIERFNKLPPYLQKFIVAIVVFFVIPIINNIAANLLTPHVQEVIENVFRSDTDKIRIIKKTPAKITHTKVDTSHLRFITAKNGLNVRSAPSTKKSTIKDTIHLGKIVEVLEKRKNWVKISYKIDDKVLRGWVFTRYTKRFDQ